MRILPIIANDMRLQFRNGLYLVYLIVGVVYVLLLRFLPERTRLLVLPFLVYSDPAFLGFFFIGGILYLDRQSQMLLAFIVSPAKITDYVTGKIVSLSLLSLSGALFITFLTAGFSFNFVLLTAGVLLAALQMSLLGLIASTFFRTLNQYIFLSVLFTLPFVPGMVLTILNASHPAWTLLPGKAPLELITAAFSSRNVSAGRLTADISISLGYILLLGWAAAGIYKKRIRLSLGEQS